MLRYRAFLKNLQSMNVEGRYLEIGAGPGVLAVEIARAHPEVEITAVEISPDMTTVGGEYVDKNGLEERIEFVIGDADDEVLIDSIREFNLVYCTYTLRHWVNAASTISNLNCAVANDGVLYLYDLRRVWWLFWVPIYNRFFKSIRAAYTPAEVRSKLRGSGIKGYKTKNEFPFMQSIFI